MLHHHNGKEKLEICHLGCWTDRYRFQIFLHTNLLIDPNELCKIPAYKRVRQEVLHFFCSCKVDPNDPGGDARHSRQVSPFHHTDTSLLDDTKKLFTYQRCTGMGICIGLKKYAYIMLHVCVACMLL